MRRAEKDLMTVVGMVVVGVICLAGILASSGGRGRCAPCEPCGPAAGAP